MDLILKPTSLCNFKCKFCSTAELKIKHSPKNVPNEIKEIIKTLNPNLIIVTGGEPLCCDPEYYEEILNIFKGRLCFTSNLKDFYLHPDKWKSLFCNERFYLGTSFNYGNTRMWDDNTVYTEKMFRDVCSLYKEYTGENPPFIAVIDESNEDRYIDHVLLAKELETYCRLNNALKVGRQGKHYPRYKIFKMWIDIINKGLGRFEQNCFERTEGRCPMNTNFYCESCIRSVYMGTDGKIHYSNCEDKLNRNKNLEIPIEIVSPKPKQSTLDYKDTITKKCIYCELLNICNACSTNRNAAKQDFNYCSEMSKIKYDIIKAGWKL